MAVSQWSINKSVPVTFYKEDILELRKYIPWAYDPYRSLDWRSIEDKLDKAIDEFEADE